MGDAQVHRVVARVRRRVARRRWLGVARGGGGYRVRGRERDSGDVFPSVEPVRSHVGVNMAGSPVEESTAGGQDNKMQEIGVVGKGKRRVERKDACHCMCYISAQ